MPFTKGPSDDLSHLRGIAYGWGKVVSRRAYGDEGPGLDIDFDSIESLAVEIGQAVGVIREELGLSIEVLPHAKQPLADVRVRPSVDERDAPVAA